MSPVAMRHHRKAEGAEIAVFRRWLLKEGRVDAFRWFPELGIYTATRRLLFHHTLFWGFIGDCETYEERWCYPDGASALRALIAWDASAGGEPDGWNRHPKSGRRRPGCNPQLEERDR